MPETQIQISRDGVVLGSMTVTEAVELLQLGLLKPGDQFCADDLTVWKPLGELQRPSEPPSGKSGWLGQTKRSLSTARAAVVHTAGEWASKAKDLVGTTQAGAASVTDKLLSGFIPQIRKIVSGLTQTKPFQALRSGVNDDRLMLKVFGAAYDCLPKPVCRFVSEHQFIAFCMKHRDQLLKREPSEPGEAG